MAKNSYYTQAEKQTKTSYNKQRQALKNSYEQNKLNLEQQKTGINQGYDNQVKSQNLNNKLGKNNLSNAMLGRGLANSSIAVSGLAEADNINSRVVNEINAGRRGDLANVDQQKTLLGQNYQNTLSQMDADREDSIWSLARQLEDRDAEKNFRNQQLALERERMGAESAYRNQQMAMQQQLQQSEMLKDLLYINSASINPETGKPFTDLERLNIMNAYKDTFEGIDGMDSVYNKADYFSRQYAGNIGKSALDNFKSAVNTFYDVTKSGLGSTNRGTLPNSYGDGNTYSNMLAKYGMGTPNYGNAGRYESMYRKYGR